MTEMYQQKNRLQQL